MATDKTASTTNEEFEWVTVSDPATATADIKMVFEVIGDEFTGIWEGFRNIGSGENAYKQARFSDDEGSTYFCNSNYSLTEALSKVRIKSRVRVTYSGDLDTGQESPMRVFKVDVARPTRGAIRTGGIVRAGSTNT